MKQSNKLNVIIVINNVSHLFNDSNYPVAVGGGASVQTYSWIVGLSNYTNVPVLTSNLEAGSKKSILLHLDSINT